jgi:2-keto-4-pentenoate hydratase/2-oxohepta-3-ene-1,7-dioic acid hydratase in catechol pathway
MIMVEYFLASITADADATEAVVVLDGHVHALPQRPTMAALIEDWDGALDRVERAVAEGALADGCPLGEVTLVAPIPRPPNLYMIGANYADHAREMNRLGPDDPVVRSAEGPFVFLKPTTTVIGPGATVTIGPGAPKVDWEVELAAVIGRGGHRIAQDSALGHVGAWTVANDVSVRGRFRRGPDAEPAMAFDWFAQKAWATSCPMGPWLLPARRRPDPAGLGIELTVNGQVHQASTTDEMLFSVAEQIAYISAIVPLVAGDVICTGTCAGVGAGRGTFLADGDVMVATIDAIGRLENRVALKDADD